MADKPTDDPEIVIRRDYIQTLLADYGIADKAVREDDTQYNRRTLVRTLFSVVEGLTSMLKEDAISLASKRNITLTAAELALLSEEEYSVDERGNARTRTRFLPALANVRFAVTTYVRLLNPDYKLDWNSPGWNAFRQALEKGDDSGAPLDLSTEDIAAKFVEL